MLSDTIQSFISIYGLDSFLAPLDVIVYGFMLAAVFRLFGWTFKRVIMWLSDNWR